MTMKVAKKSGSPIDAVNNTLELTGKQKLTDEEETFWNQVNPDTTDENENQMLKAVAFIRMNYDVFRHEIYGDVWIDDKPLTDVIENGIWLDCQEAGGKVSVQQIHSILHSPRFPSKDPLRDYIESIQCEGTDAIEQVIESLNAADKEQAYIFLMYWFMATMQNLYSYPVPYCPVLVGEQGNGKTYFIRNLMTKFLKHYYIEKQLSLSNDDKIQMCHNWIVCNDEFGGSMIRENSSFKQLLSAEKFVLRKAYGRNAEEYKRIASMIATSNEAKILTDHTGNRRLLPILIQGKINFELYNQVDKEKLWGQVYTAWINKTWPVEMTQEHLDTLKIQSDDYYDSNVYEEYISECFEPHEDGFCTNTEIMMTLQPYLKKQVDMSEIGKAMVKLGYGRGRKLIDGKRCRGYKIRVKETRIQIVAG
jgi:predicted P-loop ATPase